MNKIFNLFALTAMAASAFVMTACSDDDGPEGPVKPSPDNVFENAMPAAIDGATITKDAQGQVSKIVDGTETITFEYGTFSRAQEFQVRMTIADSEYPDEGSVIYMQLNDKGFVSYALQQYNDGTEDDTWRFEYEKDGHLSRLQRSEGGDDFKINYSNGNISTVVWDETDGDHREYTFSYTNAANSKPVANKGCLMLFDEFFCVDMDEMAPAYFAGLLGKATKDLPMGYTMQGREGGSNYTESCTYAWKFNADGYPTEFRDGEDEYDVTTFSWR